MRPPLRQRVTADDELLRFGDLEFNPGAAAPAAFRTLNFSFSDQPLEAEFFRNSEQFLFATAKLIEELNVFRRLLEKVGQQFTPGRERLFTQIFSLQKEDIENVVDQRYTSGAFE